jgi:electron transfer flavoprotein alpha subunit
VIAIDPAEGTNLSPGLTMAALESVVEEEKPRVVLMGSTSAGLDLGPALAARHAWPTVAGCKAFSAEGDALKVTASFCGGKMLADVQVTSAPAVLLVPPGSFPAAAASGDGVVETKPCPSPASVDIQFEEMLLPEAGDVDITQQDVLLAVGRGIQQEDNLEIVEELGEILGAPLCASRPVIDQGWLPTTRQVGKSGMIVKPKCYFALGVSGAPEHVEGMADSELIIAVNTDPDAPVFEVAHFGVVGDLLDVVPAITEALRSGGSA